MYKSMQQDSYQDRIIGERLFSLIISSHGRFNNLCLSPFPSEKQENGEIEKIKIKVTSQGIKRQR